MSRMRMAKIDFKYLLFAELYVKLAEPKSKRKAFGLLEAAITCYAKRGFESVTLEMIAREAGVSRPLLLHYFEDADDIRDFAVKYIRLLFQKLVLASLPADGTADLMLASYVKACFAWVRGMRSHALVWLAFLHRCSDQAKLRELNSLASAVGEDRISNLILKGQTENVFGVVDAPTAAKLIQAFITGSLVVTVSENVENAAHFESKVLQQCLAVAGAGAGKMRAAI